MPTTASEDTIILSALTPDYTDVNEVYEALEHFFKKKKEIDYNDRFNGIMFSKKGPQYLEDFTLNPEYLLKAIAMLKGHIGPANVAGGIFIAATFVAEIFKKISGKVFRLIILTDAGSSQIAEDHISFLEDLLDKVKDMPFIMDVIRIKINDPKEDLVLMKLARRTRGDIYEIKEVNDEAVQTIKESAASFINKISSTTLKLKQRIKNAISEEKENPSYEEINQLSAILEKLANKKDVKQLFLGGKIDIPERNLLFYESLAESLQPVDNGAEKEKCTICFTSVRQDMLKCPSCQTQVHKICEAIWAKTSNIGVPYLFRCSSCYSLIKMDKEYIKLVNSAQTPILELCNVEDLCLEEYLQNIETSKKPKMISASDPLASKGGIKKEKGKEELKEKAEEPSGIVAQEELQMIWCPHCGRMITNEYVKCPKCGKIVKAEEKPLETNKKIKEPEAFESAETYSEIDKLKMQQKSEFKSEAYNEAINVAKKIIELSKQVEDISLETEEENFIKDVQKKIEDKDKVIEIKNKIGYIKDKFNRLVAEKRISEAHKVVEEFKQLYNELLVAAPVPAIQKFLEDADKMWNVYIAGNKQESIGSVKEKVIDTKGKAKSKSLELKVEKIEEPIEKGITKVEITEEEGTETFNESLEEDLGKKKVQIQDIMKDIDKLNDVLKKSTELVKNHAYNEAIDLLESTASKITNKELGDYKVKLSERKEKLKAEIREFEKIIAQKEEQYNIFRQKGYLNAALNYCKEILRVAEQIERKDIIEKYVEASKSLQKDLDEQGVKKQSEIEQLTKKLEDLSKIINFEIVEEDTSIVVDEIPINKVSKKSSNELETMVEIVGNILQDYRKNLKLEIFRRIVAKSKSGEFFETLEMIPIQEIKTNKKNNKNNVNEIVNYSSASIFTNPFEEPLKEAVITDIVPYAFEILSIEINDKNAKETAEKKTGLEGLETQLIVNDLEKNSSVEIKYQFSKRVFRTIVFPIKDVLNIVKIYYNVRELEGGAIEILLPFTIGEDVTLKWAIIEDVVPSYYIPVIIEPKDLSHVETSVSNGNKLLGWVYNSLEAGVYLYQYQLLDFSAFEEIKTKLTDLFKKGLEAINQSDLLEVIKKSKELSELLSNYFK